MYLAEYLAAYLWWNISGGISGGIYVSGGISGCIPLVEYIWRDIWWNICMWRNIWLPIPLVEYIWRDIWWNICIWRNIWVYTSGGMPMVSPAMVAHQTMRQEQAAIHRMLPIKVIGKNFRAKTQNKFLINVHIFTVRISFYFKHDELFFCHFLTILLSFF